MDCQRGLTFGVEPNRSAHFFWLERDSEASARAYFGEWIDDIREKPAACSTASKRRARFSAPAASRCR